jgi:hypothetical protein
MGVGEVLVKQHVEGKALALTATHCLTRPIYTIRVSKSDIVAQHLCHVALLM